MANCIFATCVRYEPIQILPFVKSCRNVFSGTVVLAVGAISESARAILKHYDVRTYDLPGDVGSAGYFLAGERYKLYRKVVEEENLRFERGFICDFSDLIFQSDPFDFDREPYRIKFFLEDARIKESSINSGWVRDAYGEEMLRRLENEWISCGGTTLGSYEGITTYLDMIIEQYRQFLDRCGKSDVVLSKLPYWRGIDQAFHLYLIYTNALPGGRIVPNRFGEVQTLELQKEFSFSPAGQMLNADGRLCPVVHQYNRFPNFLPSLLRANRIAEGFEVQFKSATPAGTLSGRYSY